MVSTAGLPPHHATNSPGSLPGAATLWSLSPAGSATFPPLGKEHVVAERMPPENAHADFVQDGFVDQLSDLAAGACRRAHQGREIEEERLIENADERSLVRKLLGGRHADVDGAGRDGVNDLIVREQLRLVEDLDGNVVLGLLFDLFLEALQAPAEDGLGDRELQVGLELDLLSASGANGQHERYQQAKQPKHHRTPETSFQQPVAIDTPT